MPVKNKIPYEFIATGIQTSSGETVYAIGNFCDWNPDEAIQLVNYNRERGEWKGVVMFSPGQYEYKFIIKDHNKTLIRWCPDGINNNFHLEITGSPQNSNSESFSQEEWGWFGSGKCKLKGW